MHGKQKTLDSFLDGGMTESEVHQEAHSMCGVEDVDLVPYDDLIDKVLDDDNIRQALERVVGNRGSAGIDDMTVTELEEWLPANIGDLKEKVRAGKYKPMPVRRVEIPKPDGGTRKLGVPAVVDRLLQQAVAQVLTPIYEPLFSESSFGFRPNRSAHDAILHARALMDEGYVYAVDLDLSRFFDTLNQDILMNVVRETVKDRTLLKLIKGFIRAGAVLPDGLLVRTDEGAPQGGPLSPLLANIYLDRFDKLLEARGLRFYRYADDVAIFVRSERASERVMQSCINFLEGKQMKLKVNRDKSSCGDTRDMKFLGFRLLPRKDGVLISIHPKSVRRFKDRVRELTKRSRPWSFEGMVEGLTIYIRGWVGYYGLATGFTFFRRTDEWIRRRVRQFLFHQWKRTCTRFRNLRALCPKEHRGPHDSVSTNWIRQCWGVARMPSYWRAVKTPLVHKAMGNAWLKEKGLYSLYDGWVKVQERCSDRRVPNGMHGGWRGRPVN